MGTHNSSVTPGRTSRESIARGDSPAGTVPPPSQREEAVTRYSPTSPPSADQTPSPVFVTLILMRVDSPGLRIFGGSSSATDDANRGSGPNSALPRLCPVGLT